MEEGFGIKIVKHGDGSIWVSLSDIVCKDDSGDFSTFGAVGEHFESIEAALNYVRGLHDATTLIQDNCRLIKIPDTYYDEDKDREGQANEI